MAREGLLTYQTDSLQVDDESPGRRRVAYALLIQSLDLQLEVRIVIHNLSVTLFEEGSDLCTIPMRRKFSKLQGR